MDRGINVIGGLTRGGGLLTEVALGFMVLSIFYDVIMRYVFTAPTHWALEINTFLLVFLCVIPAGDVLRSGGQIRVTFLVDRLSPTVKTRLDLLRAFAGLFFCSIMVWKGAGVAWQAWLHNDRMSTSLGTPMVIPYLFLPLGFGLLGLQYGTEILSKQLKLVSSQKSPRAAEHPFKTDGESDQQI